MIVERCNNPVGWFLENVSANLEPIVGDWTVIFTAGAGLRTFEAASFNTWIAL